MQGFGSYHDYSADTPSPGQPLGALSRTAQAALSVATLANLLLFWAVWHQRSVVQDFLDGDRSISIGDLSASDDGVGTFSRISIAALMITAILFVLWFWRVRRNAGGYNPARQRRSQPWAFWGWICPVVALWFPFQIASDALRSTSGDTRRGMRVLGLWWAAYLFSVIVDRISASQHPATLQAFESHTTVEMIGVAGRIVAGILAVAVVAVITRALERQRHALLGVLAS